MSAIPPKADIGSALTHVRYGPEAEVTAVYIDFRFTPRKRKSSDVKTMSVLGQKQSFESGQVKAIEVFLSVLRSCE
jgi:hypothetical protein